MSFVQQLVPVLRAQDTAYALLLHLGRRGIHDPGVLAAESLEDVRDPERLDGWLGSHSADLPAVLVPEPDDVPMCARLVDSMLVTSFSIEEAHDPLTGVVLERRLKRRSVGTVNKARVYQLAIRSLQHVLARIGVRLDDTAARHLIYESDTCPDALLLAYAWELRQRALGKSKGPIVHKLWRLLVAHGRTPVTDDMLWLALDKVTQMLSTIQAGHSHPLKIQNTQNHAHQKQQ